ncbi:aliphatic sulfonate ABC transporter substrate-binding protein [Cohnella faecalis]|uniref:aliphatic sulfonate ABC transporter substrate-binding protein n=1 Tax=Cohnella faecalis TaxID=2315694 RepID=UPI0013142294|nr:aliphatic sulfonate ABC transporter substrate-binding protein [Cohnella faecalis]
MKPKQSYYPKARIGIAALVLVLTLTLLAACGKSDNSAGNGSTSPSASPSESSSGGASPSAEPSKSAEGVTVNLEASQIGPILIAKEKGWFEEEFAKYGAKVNYQALQSSSQFLEGIVSGRLDFARIGYIGTITGQAANIPFVTLSEGSDGAGDGIIVQKDSKVKSIKDLKGKKVAVSKGSSSWGLLLRALEKEGLKVSDIQLINLQPDEAQGAFQSGQVDAWGIWEPFRSNQVNNQGATVIANSQLIGAYTPGYNIARKAFADEHPELVVAYLKAYERALQWENQNFDEAVKLLAGIKKLDEATVNISLKNNVPLNSPVSDEANKSQQKTADILLSLGEIKEQLDVTKVVDNSFITKALEEYKTENP